MMSGRLVGGESVLAKLGDGGEFFSRSMWRWVYVMSRTKATMRRALMSVLPCIKLATIGDMKSDNMPLTGGGLRVNEYAELFDWNDSEIHEPFNGARTA